MDRIRQQYDCRLADGKKVVRSSRSSVAAPYDRGTDGYIRPVGDEQYTLRPVHLQGCSGFPPHGTVVLDGRCQWIQGGLEREPGSEYAIFDVSDSHGWVQSRVMREASLIIDCGSR